MRRRRPLTINSGTFAAVIRAYMTSAKFDSLARSTRINYGYLLGIAERPDTLGALPVAVIRPALVQAFLDGLAEHPAKQRNARTALRMLEKWALVRDLLAFPITTGCEVQKQTGGYAPWSDEQVALAERVVRPDLARLIILGANTGQRGSDLVKMRWSDLEEVDGRLGINVVQQKTKRQIWIPCTNALLAALSGWERRPTFLALRSDGGAWTRQYLSTLWERERSKHERLSGLHLHGLRSTAIVRLRRAGANVLQIADMVGMSEKMVGRYCRLSAQKENATAAVIHLEQAKAKRNQAD